MKKDWIKKLPPGEYDTKQLQEFSNCHCHSSIKKRMLKYGAQIRQEICENSNFYKNIFIWSGYEDNKSS